MNSGSVSPTYLRIYVLSSIAANFGGASGADALCNGSSKPTSGTYKAMLSDGTTRSAGAGVVGSQLDWVLRASTTYARADGTTVIGTTNANKVFDVTSLTNPITGGSALETWTGMDQSWGDVTAQNCAAWTNNTSGLAATGMSNQANAYLLNILSSRTCSGVFQLYCVEQ